jgi:selenocysteine lyase/cysteine desulfurase
VSENVPLALAADAGAAPIDADLHFWRMASTVHHNGGVSQRPQYARFIVAHPEYRDTQALDELRRAEYGRLDDGRQVYLDYTGGSLCSASQLREHMELLSRSVLGNPHSASPCSTATTRLVEDTRRAVLDYFNGRQYTAVFTPNATGALKLAGEAYPFAPGGRCLFTFDNHNSVNGIREFARAKGVDVEYAPITVPDLRIDRSRLSSLLDHADPGQRNLLAFPAQSNFSGVKHPLELIEEAHGKGWDVLLDAAAFVATNRLDLSAVQPGFVVMSFYKMFGYPTGVGCLLVRNDVLPALTRPWFAGGTVNFATVQGRAHLLARHEAGFEDGTLNYLSIPAVALGLRHLERVGVELIQARVASLTSWLLAELLDLRHGNGRHMVRIYGPTTMAMRGGTVTLNFYDPDGHLLDYRRVEELAGDERISLRTGCFCNPGAGEAAEGLTAEDMLAGVHAAVEMTLPRFLQVIEHRGGKSAGAIRVSLGIATNFDDVDTFLQFAAGLRDKTNLALGNVSFDVESCRVIRDGS